MKLPFRLPERYKPKKDPIKGGQAAVLVCRDSFLKRDVAVKIVHAFGKPDLFAV